MGDLDGLCVIEPRIELKRSPPQAELKTGTARSVGQLIIY